MTVENSSAEAENRWIKIIAPYRNGNNRKSWWQVANTLVPYLGLWIAMVYVFKINYWLELPLIILAAGFLVRLFIIFHDCGHGSFFKSKHLSVGLGYFLGILTFTPYHRWHHAHLIHHQTVGNLDKRGTGDVKTLTVEEYLALSKSKQLYYRIYRNPFIMFGIGAPAIFLITNRFTRKAFTHREKISVYITNAGLVLLATAMYFTIGLKTFLLLQIPVMYIASVAGVYLFYVQHQFEDTHWYKDSDWDFKTVAINGSSFFKLPGIIQWFSGNIGYHHVHHLSSKIPNYRLQKCHEENEMFHIVKPIHLAESFKTTMLKLWDSKTGKLVGFKEVKVRS